MTEKPILFSGEMVRVILEGRKTQTRRVVKGGALDLLAPNMFTPEYVALKDNGLSPYGFSGDRLWVRENGWERPERTQKMMREGADTWPRYLYDADDCDHAQLREWGWKRRPSIHMPRWASRITIEITGVRVERLRDISEEDARAEGVPQCPAHWKTETPYKAEYERLWDSINSKRGFPWSSNPWVWVISFRLAAPQPRLAPDPASCESQA